MVVCRSLARSPGLWAVLVIAGLLLSGGCNPAGHSGPTGTVTGTVTLDGEPAPEGCTVAFISIDGHAASGKVGKNVQGDVRSGRKDDRPLLLYQTSDLVFYEGCKAVRGQQAGHPQRDAPAASCIGSGSHNSRVLLQPQIVSRGKAQDPAPAYPDARPVCSLNGLLDELIVSPKPSDQPGNSLAAPGHLRALRRLPHRPGRRAALADLQRRPGHRGFLTRRQPQAERSWPPPRGRWRAR